MYVPLNTFHLELYTQSVDKILFKHLFFSTLNEILLIKCSLSNAIRDGYEKDDWCCRSTRELQGCIQTNVLKFEKLWVLAFPSVAIRSKSLYMRENRNRLYACGSCDSCKSDIKLMVTYCIWIGKRIQCCVLRIFFRTESVRWVIFCLWVNVLKRFARTRNLFLRLGWEIMNNWRGVYNGVLTSKHFVHFSDLLYPCNY